MDRNLQEFLNQSWKSLLRLDTALATLETGSSSVGALERILGVIRAIRDQAATLDLVNLEMLAGASTALLQKLRTGEEEMGPTAISIVLEAIDAIKEAIVEFEATGQESEIDRSSLIVRLERLSGEATSARSETAVTQSIEPSIRIHAPTSTASHGSRTGSAEAVLTDPLNRSYLVNPRVPDHLMELVDELNAARDRIQELPRDDKDLDLEDTRAKIEEIDRITDELRETVATIWLQPVISDAVRRRSSSSSQVLGPTTPVSGVSSKSQYDTLHRLPAIGPDTLAGLSVLVVDDSLFFRQLAIAALEAAGGKVTAVKDIAIAAERLGRGECFNAVLADVELPEIHNREFAKWIRTDKHRLPLIGLMSGTTPLSETCIHQAGFDRCVPKYHTRQLIAAIDDLCGDAERKPGVCAEQLLRM